MTRPRYRGAFFEFSALSLSPSTLSWEWAMSTTLKKVSEWITEDHGILGHRLRSVIDSLLWHSNAMGNLDRNSRRTSVNSTVKHLSLYAFLVLKNCERDFSKKESIKRLIDQPIIHHWRSSIAWAVIWQACYRLQLISYSARTLMHC